MNQVTAAAFTSYQSFWRTGGGLDASEPQAGSSGGMALIRWKRLGAFFLVGPISGPLLPGGGFNYREGRPVLASLYAVALAEFVVLLPWVTTAMGLKLL